MHEGQVQAVYKEFNQLSDNSLFKALAFAFDGGEAFHVYTSLPIIQLTGYPCGSAIKFFTTMPKFNEVFNEVSSIYNLIINTSEKPAVIILFALENTQLVHRAFIIEVGKQPIEGELKFIPEHSDIFSRSKGLIETTVLEQCKVAVVGLGSGGSVSAVELAKAGVGSFVLIDFDRLELSNISRHMCGIGDLGRYKTKAVRDLLYARNPYIQVETAEIDINESEEQTDLLLSSCDLIIAATDNNRSRFNLNRIALRHKIPIIFGRAITRAAGGDVLRVRPYETPCLVCVFGQGGLDSRKEEISRFAQARASTPAYITDFDVNATVQVGLSADILPISNMIVKLALIELSRGKPSGIGSLEEDLIAPLYIWANRRENVYAKWPLMKYGSRTPSILRWYGANCERSPLCVVCSESNIVENDKENIFADKTLF